METSEFSALAARVAAGLDDVRACLFVSRDGLTLGAFPPGGEAQARQSWDRLVALGGEPERGFLIVGEELWVVARRGRYTGLVVASAAQSPGLLLDRIDSALRAVEEARQREDAGGGAPAGAQRTDTPRRPRTQLHREPTGRVRPDREPGRESDSLLGEVRRMVDVTESTPGARPAAVDGPVPEAAARTATPVEEKPAPPPQVPVPDETGEAEVSDRVDLEESLPPQAIEPEAEVEAEAEAVVDVPQLEVELEEAEEIDGPEALEVLEPDDFEEEHPAPTKRRLFGGRPKPDDAAAERAEAERLAAERAEAERLAADRAEAERLAAEAAAEADRAAAAEADRAAAAEADRVAAEKAAAQRAATELDIELPEMDATDLGEAEDNHEADEAGVKDFERSADLMREPAPEEPDPSPDEEDRRESDEVDPVALAREFARLLQETEQGEDT